MRLAAFDGSTLNNWYKCQNLAKNFYARRLIANFAPNFVAMATGVDRKKIWLAAFGRPFPITFPMSSILLPCQRRSVGVNANGSIRWSISETPTHNRKIIAKISQANHVIAHFVPNYVAMTTGVGRWKMRLAAFDVSFSKILLLAQKSCKNFLRKPSYSPLCPKFRCYGNWYRSGKNAIGRIW